MARFKGTVQGNRNLVSRIGHETSGIVTECNGWQSGVHVQGRVGEDGRDVFTITATGGSNYRSASIMVGKVTVNDKGRMEFNPSREFIARFTRALEGE